MQGNLVVESRCSILLHASCSETLLSMNVEGVRNDRPNLQTEGVTLKSDVEAAVSLTAREHCVFFVERGDLSRLNDGYYIEAYRRAIFQSIAAVSSDLKSNSSYGEPELELDVNMSQMRLGGGDQNGGNQPLQVDGGSIGVATVAQNCSPTPEEISMDSDSEGSSCSGDYADCIVLDMAHGMSIFGLFAAKEGNVLFESQLELTAKRTERIA